VRRDHAGRQSVALRLIPLPLAAALVAGCGSANPGLSNGSVSACYRAIPTGKQAIHAPSATLIGVHRLSADVVRARLPQAEQQQLVGDNDTTVCAVAFKGHFAAGQVEFAPPSEAGTYAVVLVTSRKLRVLDAAVLDHLPRALGRRTL